jgi:hypothetical protein
MRFAGTTDHQSRRIVSNDTLFGQGLREESNVVGMSRRRATASDTTSLKKMIQPRLSVVRSQRRRYGLASYAATTRRPFLPRAFRDRNLVGTFIDAHFDATGVVRHGARRLLRGKASSMTSRRGVWTNTCSHELADERQADDCFYGRHAGKHLGGHEQRRAGAVQPARRVLRTLYP